MPAEAKALVWDGDTDRRFMNGVDHGVLYRLASSGKYEDGYAWNGLTAVNVSPEGGEPTDLWADNILYATMMSAEKVNFTIEAYTFPDEFAECDGSVALVPGMYVGQQTRQKFGFAYRMWENDATGKQFGVIRVLYGASAKPSEQSATTINDSPEAGTFSWECTASAVNVPDMKPTFALTFYERRLTAAQWKVVTETLWGKEGTKPMLPAPADFLHTVKAVN